MSPVHADAFWLRAPGCGEIRPVTLPEPGRDDVMVRTLRSGVSRGTETLVFRGGVPPGQYAAMRAPFQEGDFPGPVKYGYLNVGAVEQGPAELRGRTVFCLYPHQTAYVVPAGAVTVVPEDVPAGSRRSRGHGRDRGQRPVGRRAAARRPGHGRRRRHGRLLRRPPAGPVPGGAGHARRRRCRPGRCRGRARRRLRAAGRRRRRSRPRRARQRDVRRAPAIARPARARGHGHRPQLVRRQRGPAVAGRRVPLGPPRHPRQPGRHRSPRPAAGAARRPTGWRSRSSCCATPPSTRSSPGSPASASCPT